MRGVGEAAVFVIFPACPCSPLVHEPYHLCIIKIHHE